MSWEVKTPIYGDHIRVNRGFYYHHGIFAANECVIHFASNEIGHETDPNYAIICITDLDSFSKGNVVEVRSFSEEEKECKRTPQEIVNYAFTRLGEKGYDLINNNCEHFSNECVFGIAQSTQVENIKNIFKNIFR